MAKEFVTIRTDLWREGKWLDMWSIVHLLSGISVGFGLYLLHWDAWPATIVAFIVFVLYEMWEALMDIKEAPTNRLMDIVVGMVGFVPAFFVVAPMLGGSLVPVFLWEVALNAVLGFMGWRESTKANELRKRMHAGLARRKAWLARRRAAKKSGVH